MPRHVNYPQRLLTASAGERGAWLHQKIVQQRDDRRDALEAYGNVCACCGAQECLEIDHIEGNGTAHRAAIAPQHIEAWLREHGYPPQFQLLCKRCNKSKNRGPRCQIHHSTNYPNESGKLSPMNHDHAEVGMNLSDAAKQSEPLETFSTRMRASKKAELLQQARLRGCAAGVIIEELMAAPEAMTRIEQKLDLLLEFLRNQPKVSVSPSMASHELGVHRLAEPLPDFGYPCLANVPPPPRPAVIPLSRPTWWQRCVSWLS